MPDWLTTIPVKMEIVTTYFPESKPKGALKLRPCLIVDVIKSTVTGQIYCEVAYGTKNLTSVYGGELIPIHNSTDLTSMGLPVATNFVMEKAKRATLPWTEERFGCWSGRSSPRIGVLLPDYQKLFAFIITEEWRRDGKIK